MNIGLYGFYSQAAQGLWFFETNFYTLVTGEHPLQGLQMRLGIELA